MSHQHGPNCRHGHGEGGHGHGGHGHGQAQQVNDVNPTEYFKNLKLLY